MGRCEKGEKNAFSQTAMRRIIMLESARRRKKGFHLRRRPPAEHQNRQATPYARTPPARRCHVNAAGPYLINSSSCTRAISRLRLGLISHRFLFFSDEMMCVTFPLGQGTHATNRTRPTCLRRSLS